ncbi:hypothetical protein E8E11_008734 [Didymella keratinophila]|nr:hypothetical protein E8E11_008734 [Didymella keratinophila]
MRLCFLLGLLTSIPALVLSEQWFDLNDFSLRLPPSSNRAIEGDPEYDDGPVWTTSDPCPRAIHAELPCPYGPTWCRFPNISTVHSALIHCPGAEEVNLYLVDGQCKDSQVELFNHTLPIINEAKYPALKKLVLDGYRFGGSWTEKPQEGPKAWGMNTQIYSHCGMPESEAFLQDLRRQSAHQTVHTSLAAWLEVMDWEQLEELSINWGRNPERVLVEDLAGSGRLKNLKSLDITSLDFVEALDNNTLTQLRWVGRTVEGELESILAHQGRSLQRLEFRCDEAICPEFAQPFDLSTISALAPNLEYISINIPRNGSLPVGDLKTLASMRNLQTADLFFRMQSDCHAKEEALGIVPDILWWPERDDSETCNGTARYELPYINRTTAEDIFDFIREHKQGKEMQNVTLWTGDWVSGPRRNSIMSHKRAKVACAVEDGRVVCKAEGRLYFKGIWAKDDWRLNYASKRQEPGVELTDEQLWDAYKHIEREEEKQLIKERRPKTTRKIQLKQGVISYWWGLALEFYAWINFALA